MRLFICLSTNYANELTCTRRIGAGYARVMYQAVSDSKEESGRSVMLSDDRSISSSLTHLPADTLTLASFLDAGNWPSYF